MGNIFRLQPKVIDQIDFKNGLGQTLLRVIKTNDNKIVMSSQVNNYSLSSKEQEKLLDFLLVNA